MQGNPPSVEDFQKAMKEIIADALQQPRADQIGYLKGRLRDVKDPILKDLLNTSVIPAMEQQREHGESLGKGSPHIEVKPIISQTQNVTLQQGGGDETKGKGDPKEPGRERRNRTLIAVIGAIATLGAAYCGMMATRSKDPSAPPASKDSIQLDSAPEVRK